MNEDCRKLTVYFGEHQRVGRELLSDALHDLYQRHGLEAGVLLRGTEGFGLRHTLHTQRLLTLSEDLPLVSIAVDTRAKVEAAVPEVVELVGKGLVTLERARLLSGRIEPFELPAELHEADEADRLLRPGGANRPAPDVRGRDRPPPRPGHRRRDGVSRRRRHAPRHPPARPLLLPQRERASAHRLRRGGTRHRRRAAGAQLTPVPSARDARARAALQARRRASLRAGVAPGSGSRRPRRVAEADGLRVRAGAPREASPLLGPDPPAPRGRGPGRNGAPRNLGLLRRPRAARGEPALAAADTSLSSPRSSTAPTGCAAGGRSSTS